MKALFKGYTYHDYIIDSEIIFNVNISLIIFILYIRINLYQFLKNQFHGTADF